MKTKYSALVAVAACLLAVSPIQAQTFTGNDKLSASPTTLEATIYAVTNAPSMIKVNFNNRSAGAVRVIIRDENGRVVYEELESIAMYRRRFDLSALPSGRYTIELKKRDDSFSQSFTIEPPAMSRIAMGDLPIRKNPETPVDKKLIVSY